MLLLATEQSTEAISARLNVLSVPQFSTNERASLQIVDDLGDLSVLPQFLARNVFSRTGRFQGISVIIIDSLHGYGNAANDRHFYAALFEYLRTASAAGITTLALAHMTKGGQVGGPRTLEHMIDLSIVMRHGISCRALYIPKNRNGPSRTEPFAVVVDENTTRIIPSALTVSSSARVSTIAPDGLIFIEVALSLPRHERGFVKSPGLSINEIGSIVDLLVRLYPPARTLGSLGVTVRAPGGIRFRRDFSLAIAVGIAAALARVDVPECLVVVGDVDLRGNVCPPCPTAIRHVADAYTSGELNDSHDVVSAPIPPDIGVELGEWNLTSISTIHDAFVRCLMLAE